MIFCYLITPTPSTFFKAHTVNACYVWLSLSAFKDTVLQWKWIQMDATMDSEDRLTH